MSRPTRWKRATAAAQQAAADLEEAVLKLGGPAERLEMALKELIQIQAEYRGWTVPAGLENSRLAEKLDHVLSVDFQHVLETIPRVNFRELSTAHFWLDEVGSRDLPRGFGRD